MGFATRAAEKYIDGGDKLRRAAILIQQAMKDLDTETSTCACCGAIRNKYWNHKAVHDKLMELPDRLRRIADGAPYSRPASQQQESRVA